MIQLCWMPTWSCQNYSPNGEQSINCPYCPLGIINGHLSYNGWQTSASNTPGTAADIAGFITRHAQLFGFQLTLSGGEPLASPNTADVLRTIERHGFTWGITSNTLLRKRIAELGSLHACRAWTASYHPHAHDREPFEQGARQVRSQAPQALYANLVISSHTAATAEDDTAWLHSLGIFDRINLLVDMYHDQQLAELATDICIRHHHTLAVGSGKTITGANCRRFDRFLVLNPTGDLYECVRKAYHGIDRIGNARDLVFQANGTIDHCTLDCPHTCDQTKHA